MGISNIKLTIEIIAYKLFCTVFKITDNTVKSYMQTLVSCFIFAIQQASRCTNTNFICKHQHQHPNLKHDLV